MSVFRKLKKMSFFRLYDGRNSFMGTATGRKQAGNGYRRVTMDCPMVKMQDIQNNMDFEIMKNVFCKSGFNLTQHFRGEK